MKRFKTHLVEAQLNEENCSCCDNKIDANGKCGCGPDCEHCGGQHDVDEGSCGTVNASKKNESSAHPEKHIKMAIGIASDPRYKGGNMTGAHKAIEKLSKGLASHPKVAAVLRRQNEELSEAKKAKPGHNAAVMSKNISKVLSAVKKEEFELDEAVELDEFGGRGISAADKENLRRRIKDKKKKESVELDEISMGKMAAYAPNAVKSRNDAKAATHSADSNRRADAKKTLAKRKAGADNYNKKMWGYGNVAPSKESAMDEDVDSKKFDVYKKHMKTHNLDEPTVRMAHDNPDHGESKRMMKNPKYSKGLELYKASMKEAAQLEDTQIDEISNKTIDSYRKKAYGQYKTSADKKGDSVYFGSAKPETRAKHAARYDKRHKGIGSADKRTMARDPDNFKFGKIGRDGHDPKNDSMSSKSVDDMRKIKGYSNKQEDNLGEAAPKIKQDNIKAIRGADNTHDNAMGRTATGRKKPVRTMTSTQKSLASMREELDEDIINNLTAAYINENNIDLVDIENMTEEELNELIGKAIGGAFKLGAKAIVGSARLAKKGINRMSTSGRADAAEKKADKFDNNVKAKKAVIDKKARDRDRIKAAADRLRDAKKAAQNK